MGTEDMAVLTCQGMARGGSGGKGIQVVGEVGQGQDRMLRATRPSSEHPFPELQETLRAEQETDIIRFAFWPKVSGVGTESRKT